jgi:hypothetical protein
VHLIHVARGQMPLKLRRFPGVAAPAPAVGRACRHLTGVSPDDDIPEQNSAFLLHFCLECRARQTSEAE